MFFLNNDSKSPIIKVTNDGSNQKGGKTGFKQGCVCNYLCSKAGCFYIGLKGGLSVRKHLVFFWETDVLSPNFICKCHVIQKWPLVAPIVHINDNLTVCKPENHENRTRAAAPQTWNLWGTALLRWILKKDKTTPIWSILWPWYKELSQAMLFWMVLLAGIHTVAYLLLGMNIIKEHQTFLFQMTAFLDELSAYLKILFL